MDSPVNGVLAIYELLERILLAVPMEELFVTQRVSKAWKAIVERSQALQKKMFLLADGQPLMPTSSTLGTPYGPEYRHDLRLPSVVTVLCMGENHSAHSSGLEEDPLPGAYCTRRMPKSGPTDVAFEVSPFYDYEDPDKPEYGWRKLLIAQPPITAIELHGYRKRTSTASEAAIECTVYNPAGLTMGDIYDLCGHLQKQALEHPSTAFDGVYMQFTVASESANQSNATGADAEGKRNLGDCTCDVIGELLAE